MLVNKEGEHFINSNDVNQLNDNIINKIRIPLISIPYISRIQDGAYLYDQGDYQARAQHTITKHKLEVHDGGNYDRESNSSDSTR